MFQQLLYLEPDGSTRKHYYVDESVGIAVGMPLTAQREGVRGHPIGYPADDCVVRTSLDQVVVTV